MKPFVLALALLAGGPIWAQPASAPGADVQATRFRKFTRDMLAGTWAGKLPPRRPLTASTDSARPDTTPVELRIELSADAPRVFLKQQGQWLEAMPGGFTASLLYSNALLVGVQSDDGPVPSWIETWTLQLTALDDDTVLAEWTRAVSNTGSKPYKTPAFTMAASGRLHRVPDHR